VASDAVTLKHEAGRPRAVRRLRIRVVEGAETGRSHDADLDRASVGTSPDNDLVLADPTVSRYHVEIARARDGGLLVEDLGSLNGTLIGAARVERAIVPAGTRVKLGATTLEVGDGDPAAFAAEPAPPEIASLVATSVAMQQVVATVRRLAPSGVSVLIQGETGTGKELVARALHDLRSETPGPWVVVDCGSMPATLVASELFGHEKGAFTGADRRHVGAFERASGGTLFLDEIGELPMPVQPALLGALERKRIRRVGGDREIPVELRVVCATHRDLRAECNCGSFRADLYFRLAAARIVLPPLRDRPDDVEPLVRHFVREITGSDEAAAFGPATLEAMRAHHWSGNVRELRNVVETALAMGSVSFDTSLEAGLELPVEPSPASLPLSYREARAQALARFEQAYLRALIQRAGGNASEAARLARMDRPYLLTLLRKQGLR
jgi:DNA-binding NtrC family response regulator